LTNRKAQPPTWVLQKSGLSAKLNICAFYPQKPFLFAGKCKLANKKNGFAHVGAKLKVLPF